MAAVKRVLSCLVVYAKMGLALVVGTRKSYNQPHTNTYSDAKVNEVLPVSALFDGAKIRNRIWQWVFHSMTKNIR